MSRFAYAMLGGVALMTVAAAPSFAQSAFDGPYVGVYTGYTTSNDTTRAPGAKADLNLDGWTYGGFFGYGKTFDRLYLGGEGELGGLELSDKTKLVGGRVTGLDGNETYGISARAGYLVTNDALVYGRVGWQRTNYEVNSALAGTSVSKSDTLNGVRVGGGVEYAVTDNILARLEYNYTDYEALKYTAGGTAYSLQPDDSQIRVGVAYRF